MSGGAKGNSRNPGEFRSIQNFIGPQGCTIQTASYIPPEPKLVPDYMSNLEKYINEPTDNLNDLIRIAIIHAQFETIHPFLDANGRIGRKLITSNKLIDIIKVMFEKSIFTKKTILERVEIPSSTLGVYLNKLEEEKLIYSDGKARNRKYYFYDLINILRQQ